MSKKGRKEKLKLEQIARKEEKRKIHNNSGELGKRDLLNYNSWYDSLEKEARLGFTKPGNNITKNDYHKLKLYMTRIESNVSYRNYF